MAAGQLEEILALGLVFVVHLVGGVMLVWGMLDDDRRGSWWRRRHRDDDGDPPRAPQPPPPGRQGQRWPLPDASPSQVRLRQDGRVGDGYQRPARRPEHPPQPAPARTRPKTR